MVRPPPYQIESGLGPPSDRLAAQDEVLSRAGIVKVWLTGSRRSPCLTAMIRDGKVPKLQYLKHLTGVQVILP